jgi:hypothetical protein
MYPKLTIWEKGGIAVFNGVFVIILTVFNFFPCAFGWSSETHIFIATEAGIKNPEVTCFPDLAREENITLSGPFHWHDAAPTTIVTPDYIDRYQITEGMYVKVGVPESKPIKVKVPDHCGVLYWKILELYQQMKGTTGWEYEYYLTTIAHYVGDLSQPLHNFPYADNPASDGKCYPEIGFWAKENHQQFDSVLDSSLPLTGKEKETLQTMITPIQIVSVDNLKKEISKIANTAIGLANMCYAEKRLLTRDEALRQIAMSVSLLRAIMKNTNNNLEGGKNEKEQGHDMFIAVHVRPVLPCIYTGDSKRSGDKVYTYRNTPKPG